MVEFRRAQADLQALHGQQHGEALQFGREQCVIDFITSLLCFIVYATDLRSSHADGHGASAEAQEYWPNENLTIEYTVPDIGDGFLSVVATFSHGLSSLSLQNIC